MLPILRSSRAVLLPLAFLAACGTADPINADCEAIRVSQTQLEVPARQSGTVTVTVPEGGGGGMLSVGTPTGDITAAYTSTLGLDATGEHTLQITCGEEGTGSVSVYYAPKSAHEQCRYTIEVTCTAPPTTTLFPTGTYPVNGGGPIALRPAPWFQILQAGSSASMIYAVIAAEILLTLQFFEIVVALETASGNPAAAFAFPGLRMTVDLGAGYVVPVVLDSRPVRDAIGVPVKGAWQSAPHTVATPSSRFCALFDDKTVSCYGSVGDAFQVEPASVTDAGFLAPCDATPPVGQARGLAVANGYVLVAEGVGTVCHGQLGAGHQATRAQAVGRVTRGLRCPIDETGAAPLCGMLTDDTGSTAELQVLAWPTPSAPPTLGTPIDTCFGARNLAAMRSSDGSTTCFAFACPGVAVEEICLTTATGAQASHTKLDIPDCNGRYAAYANEAQLAVVCPTNVRIFDRAAMTPK